MYAYGNDNKKVENKNLKKYEYLRRWYAVKDVP